MMRAPNLRMAALATVVAAAAMLPLTGATAGPVLPAVPVDVTTAVTDDKPLSSDSSIFDTLPKLAESERQTASCGPQLASPAGLRAQTCTIDEDGDTWARTYYTNTTGRPLDGVLTLMRPDGRTVQARCVITADEGSGSCETPREPTVAEVTEPYMAVAEIAEEGGEHPLLRSGSTH
ncbi:hypothetical protein [Actinacidiphila sp. bgisy160]|uniref:hypothetical protein n=1 Tax=Actinacidiphila sp. bgisy160 TaxID=3413796 RepID=UPI003D73C5E6